jgi:SAM-dependent methyltransferase
MNKIKTFIIDSGDSKTDLCELGNKSDKSPYCIWEHYHKHPYTPIYSLLLAPYRNKTINFCEIGIAGGESIKMWREYFNPDSVIYAMDSCDDFLAMTNNRNLKNVVTRHIDVGDPVYMNKVFTDINTQFDIIVDDSDHNFESQKNIISVVVNFLKPGGLLIIEDVERSISAEKYEENLGPALLSLFESVYYIKGEHNKKYSGDYNNDTLLVFVKV